MTIKEWKCQMFEVPLFETRIHTHLFTIMLDVPTRMFPFLFLVTSQSGRGENNHYIRRHALCEAKSIHFSSVKFQVCLLERPAFPVFNYLM